MSPASIRYKLNLYYNPNVNQELTLQAACGSSGSLPLLPSRLLPFHYLLPLLSLALLYARLVAFDMPSCIYQIHQPLHAIAGETQREGDRERDCGWIAVCLQRVLLQRLYGRRCGDNFLQCYTLYIMREGYNLLTKSY